MKGGEGAGERMPLGGGEERGRVGAWGQEIVFSRVESVMVIFDYFISFQRLNVLAHPGHPHFPDIDSHLPVLMARPPFGK